MAGLPPATVLSWVVLFSETPLFAGFLHFLRRLTPRLNTAKNGQFGPLPLSTFSKKYLNPLQLACAEPVKNHRVIRVSLRAVFRIACSSRDSDNVARRRLRAANCGSFNAGRNQRLHDDVGFDAKRTVAKWTCPFCPCLNGRLVLARSAG